METTYTSNKIEIQEMQLDQELKQMLINDLIKFKSNKGRFLGNNQGKKQGNLLVA